MSGITFAVLDVTPEPYSVTPVLRARVGVASLEEMPVHAIALRCQVRIEPMRRHYDDEEAAGLTDLFGPRERWADTQRTFLWLHCATMLRGFSGATEIDLPLECTYDFDVAASKYLHSLKNGSIPLLFLFSGTAFLKGPNGFSVQQIPWDREDRHELPVATWRALMRQHFPNTGWLRLREETIEALVRYKAEHGLLDFDETLGKLLGASA